MSFFMCVLLCLCFLLRDKPEAKFGGVMSAQKTYDIPTFYHVLVSFPIVISAVIALYLILGFFCTSSEKGGI